MSGWFLFLATFLASAVEMVEALTIILAVGLTRGWRSALIGTTAALLALTIIVVVFGPALSRIPLETLRLVVGGLLLIFGVQWWRKAILRASGFKALHDEDATFVEETETAKHQPQDQRIGLDWYGFTLSFKSVLLEGLEVAFIVVTFGASAQRVDLAALGAVAALLIVLLAGVLLHKPLSLVPENTLKFAVGLMLSSFGTFWAAEGAGAHWLGNDASILGILLVYSLASFVYVTVLRREKLARVTLKEVSA